MQLGLHSSRTRRSEHSLNAGTRPPPNLPARCPDAPDPRVQVSQPQISPGPKHPCAPSPSLGIPLSRPRSPQDTGVPAPHSSGTQKSPSCQPASFPYRQDRQSGYLAAEQAPGAAWGRPGGVEGPLHRPRGARGAARRAGCGAWLSAPTSASQTWRRAASAGGRGRGLPEPRPPRLRPRTRPARFSLVGGPATLGSEFPRPTVTSGVRMRTSDRSFPTPSGEHRSPGTVSTPLQEAASAPEAPRDKTGTLHPSPLYEWRLRHQCSLRDANSRPSLSGREPWVSAHSPPTGLGPHIQTQPALQGGHTPPLSGTRIQPSKELQRPGSWCLISIPRRRDGNPDIQAPH